MLKFDYFYPHFSILYLLSHNYLLVLFFQAILLQVIGHDRDNQILALGPSAKSWAPKRKLPIAKFGSWKTSAKNLTSYQSLFLFSQVCVYMGGFYCFWLVFSNIQFIFLCCRYFGFDYCIVCLGGWWSYFIYYFNQLVLSLFC